MVRFAHVHIALFQIYVVVRAISSIANKSSSSFSKLFTLTMVHGGGGGGGFQATWKPPCLRACSVSLINCHSGVGRCFAVGGLRTQYPVVV